MKRRDFLALVGAGYPETEVWAFEGTVPGPELRFRQGERDDGGRARGVRRQSHETT